LKIGRRQARAEARRFLEKPSENENLIFHKVTTLPLGTNAYFLTCRNTGESALIDAPGEAEEILARFKEKRPKWILLTHGHWDHTGALSQLKSRLNSPIAIHPSDSSSLPVLPDVALSGGEHIRFGDISLKVLHTPGHTPGSLCFLFEDRHLFSGDTLFPGGPGKTRTPEAFAQIVSSLRDKIFILPDNLLIHPGHGDSTVLGKEKKAFAAFSSLMHAADLCGDVLWKSE